MDANTLSTAYTIIKWVVLLLIVAPSVLMLGAKHVPYSKRFLWSVLSAIVGLGGLILSLSAPYLGDAWLSGSLKFALAVIAFLAALSVPWLLFILFRRKFATYRAA